jgi:hypothetical protein
VLGDADALTRALRNLIDNAITAAGQAGRPTPFSRWSPSACSCGRLIS